MNNIVTAGGNPTYAGNLGNSVGTIFNKEFFYVSSEFASAGGTTGYKDRGVPVPRLDFCGYGANIFSRWFNPNAIVAATSQVVFDVFVGRTAHEVIQVRSLLYPWGVRVVRTITLLRGSDGYVFRFDTGWQAESDGLYDFRYVVYDPPFTAKERPSPYTFHPGVVKGIFRVRNIQETNKVPNYKAPWTKNNPERFVDENGVEQIVPGTMSLSVDLQPVYFDADVEIEGIVSGGSGGRTPSRGMLGFVQLSPRSEPIAAAIFQICSTPTRTGRTRRLSRQCGGQWSADANQRRRCQRVHVARADRSSSARRAAHSCCPRTDRGAWFSTSRHRRVAPLPRRRRCRLFGAARLTSYT